MGFGSFLKKALTAPIRATKSIAKGAHKSTVSLAKGRPIAAAKAMTGGHTAAGKTMARSMVGKR